MRVMWAGVLLLLPLVAELANAQRCSGQPDAPEHATIRCFRKRNTCRATCDSGYIFPETNAKSAIYICEDGEWVMRNGEDSRCTPVCKPPCKNGGYCTTPNQCDCHQGYEGASCELPICEPACESGECIEPDVCYCDEGFTGDHCEEEEDEYLEPEPEPEAEAEAYYWEEHNYGDEEDYGDDYEEEEEEHEEYEENHAVDEDIEEEWGFSCDTNEDCTSQLTNSGCDGNQCYCFPPYVVLDKVHKECMKAAPLNSTCRLDHQCQFNNDRSFCNQDKKLCQCMEGFIMNAYPEVGLVCLERTVTGESRILTVKGDATGESRNLTVKGDATGESRILTVKGGLIGGMIVLSIFAAGTHHFLRNQ